MSSLSRLSAPVLCAVLAAACDSASPTAPAPGRAPLAAAAFTFTEQESHPVGGVLFNECTNEFVEFSGSFHTVFHVTENGNTLHVSGKGNASNIKAVGLSTGARYVGSQAEQFTLNLSRGITVTENGTFQSIGQGAVPNLTVNYLVHLTVNANGTLTTSVDNLSLSCK